MLKYRITATLILYRVVLHCQQRHSRSTLYHPTKVVSVGKRIRSRITVHLPDFQLQLN